MINVSVSVVFTGSIQIRSLSLLCIGNNGMPLYIDGCISWYRQIFEEGGWRATRVWNGLTFYMHACMNCPFSHVCMHASSDIKTYKCCYSVNNQLWSYLRSQVHCIVSMHDSTVILNNHTTFEYDIFSSASIIGTISYMCLQERSVYEHFHTLKKMCGWYSMHGMVYWIS